MKMSIYTVMVLIALFTMKMTFDSYVTTTRHANESDHTLAMHASSSPPDLARYIDVVTNKDKIPPIDATKQMSCAYAQIELGIEFTHCMAYTVCKARKTNGNGYDFSNSYNVCSFRITGRGVMEATRDR